MGRKFSWEILPVEPIEIAPEVSLFDITGAKAAVIHEIAIREIRSSIRENAKRFLNNKSLRENFCVLRDEFR